MSEDQFLCWAETQDGRFELVDGHVMMLAGATRDHERVAKRIFASLYRQIDEALYDVNKGDFGVRIRPGDGRGSVLYPDVVVDLQSGLGDERATTTPIVIVEVLSRSTDLDHHVAKLSRYRMRASLRQYVVFEPKVPRAYAWEPTAAGWPSQPREIAGPGAGVSFPAVGASVGMADIYR